MSKFNKRLGFLSVAAASLVAVGQLLRANAPAVPANNWAPTGTLAAARAAATATLMYDGHVLVAGGIGDAGAPTPRVERYSADGEQFLNTPDMAAARANHTATLLPDGSVLVAGGTDATGSALASAEVYDAQQNAWHAVAPMNVPRTGHTATALFDGRVVFAGGADHDVAIGSIEIYDPYTETFELIATPMTTARAGHAAALTNDGIVVIAGGDDGTSFLSSIDLFDPFFETVTPAARLGTARGGLTATTLLDGKILLLGGANDGGALASGEVYDPTANVVSPTANAMASARQSHQAILLPHNNQVLIVGGVNGNETVAGAEVYVSWQGDGGSFFPTNAPATARAWSALAALSFNASLTIRSGPNDGLLLMTGGGAADGSAAQKTTDLYGFATVTTDKADYEPGTTVQIAGGGWIPGESVSLILVEQQTGDTHALSPVVADQDGRISSSEFAPDDNDVGVRFYLTASGEHSQAQTSFLDNKNLTIIFAGNGSGSVALSNLNPSGSFPPCISSPCVRAVDNNQRGSLTATPLAGSVFIGWSASSFGDDHSSTTTCIDSTNPCTFFMGTGGGSAQSITATFQKSDFVGSVAVGAQSGTVIYGTPGSVTYSVTVTRGTSTGSFEVSLSIGTLPSGVTASFAPSSLSFASGDSSKSGTLTLATTSNAFAQTATSFAVSAVDTALATDFKSGTGTISIGRRPATVTATASSKAYDGTSSSPATPSVTPPLVNGNTSNFIQTYDNRNAGQSKTLTPSGTIADGNNGGNYIVTFVNNTSGVITARALTITATADSKNYDGTTVSSASPTISAPGIAAGDSGSFTQAFLTKHVGTAKTIVPSGVISDGNGGSNYALTFVNSTAGEIKPRAITVTAVADSKPYDGNATSSGVPIVGSPGIAPGDSANFTQSFDNKNRGNGKTLTPAGVVNDGNSGNNYAVLFVPVTTGQITARAIIVTAVSDTKPYDGTASSSGTPTIGAPGLASGDTAAFTQSFDTKHAGQHKLVTPAGSVMDGNNGNNYAVTFASVSTGEITARAITVTAVTDSKSYDGTADSSGTPTIGAPGIASGDTANFIQAFESRNAGSNKTLTPSGSVNDGNGGLNYDVAFVPVGTGDISRRALTVTATTDTKPYDGTTSSAATPAISNPGIASGDLSAFTQAFDTRNVGQNKTITPAGSVNDGNNGDNYTIAFVSVSTGEITKRVLTVTAVSDTKPYDGTVSSSGTPTVSAPGIAANDSAAFIQSFDTKHAGQNKTLTPTGSVNDGNGGDNYALTFVPISTGVISQATLTLTAITSSKTYDGTVTAAATPGIGGLVGADSVTSLSEVYTDPNAGTGKTLVVAAGFVVHDGNGGNNYTVTLVADHTGVIDKADATVHVTGYSGVYDGDAHGASGTATGVNGVDLSGALNLGASFTNVPGGTANWTFAGGVNYHDQSGSVPIAIARAGSTTVVTFEAGPYTYRAAPFTASASATGVGLASPIPVVVVYSGDCINVTGPNGCTGTATFPGDSNHEGSTDAKSITIAQATSTTTVTCPSLVSYTGVALTPCTASYQGVGNLSGSLTPAYSNNLNAGTATASANYPGDANHTASSDSKNFTIDRADADIIVNGYSGIYDAALHGATLVKAQGVGPDTDLSGFLDLGAQFKNVPGGSAHWTFSHPNYNPQSGDVSITIGLKPASVTPDNGQHKIYGDPDPVLTGSTSGFLAADGVTAIFGRTAGQSVGSYTISATLSPAAVLSNYSVQYNTAQFSIGARPVTVTPTSGQFKVYGGADPALTYAVGGQGLAYGDGFSGALSRDPGVNVGSYEIRIGTLTLGAAAGNYDLTFTTGVTFEIKPLPIIVTPTAGQFKTYGAADPILGYTFAPALVAGDAFTGALSRTAGLNAGLYDITGGTLALSSNYSLSVTPGVKFEIRAKALTLTANNRSKFYGTVVTFTGTEFTASGLVGTETVTSVGLTSPGAAANAAVGSYDINITPGSAVFGNGGQPGNYSITLVKGTLTVGAWTTQGFFAPVDMTPSSAAIPLWNVVKGGSTVPLKFRLFAGTVEQTAVTAVKDGTVKIGAVPCSNGFQDDFDLSGVLNTGNTALRYDGSQFIQNWQTPKGANQCFRAVLDAADGSRIDMAFFKTK